MNLTQQLHLKPEAKLTLTVSKIEVSLVKLKADLAALEKQLQQTRGEYGRTLRHLESVKAQLAMQKSPGLPSPPSSEEVDLATYIDADWDHLIRQINSL